MRNETCNSLCEGIAISHLVQVCSYIHKLGRLDRPLGIGCALRCARERGNMSATSPQIPYITSISETTDNSHVPAVRPGYLL